MSDETKYLYYQIDFKDCALDFDCTICETLDQVRGYLQLVETDFDDPEKEASVTIKGIGMTRTGYSEFLKSIENLHP